MKGVITLFKSKVEKVYDFKTVNVPYEAFKVKIDEKDIKSSLYDEAKKHTVTVDAEDEVRRGDRVTLELQSNLDKFNKKNIPVVVGMGLFNRELEDKLQGMKKNEAASLNIGGSPVTVKVLHIKRKIVPDLTDEMIKKLRIEGINTVDEFRRYTCNEKFSKSKEEKFEEIYGIVLNEVVTKSEFTLVEEDFKELLETELNRCRLLSKMENLVFEEMTREQLMARVPCGSIDEFKVFLRREHEISLKWVLVAMEYANKDNTEFNEETYKEYINKMAAEEKTDIEKARGIYPFLKYVTFQYSMYLRKKVWNYFEPKFYCELV